MHFIHGKKLKTGIYYLRLNQNIMHNNLQLLLKIQMSVKCVVVENFILDSI